MSDVLANNWSRLSARSVYSIAMHGACSLQLDLLLQFTLNGTFSAVIHKDMVEAGIPRGDLSCCNILLTICDLLSFTSEIVRGVIFSSIEIERFGVRTITKRAGLKGYIRELRSIDSHLDILHIQVAFVGDRHHEMECLSRMQLRSTAASDSEFHYFRFAVFSA